MPNTVIKLPQLGESVAEGTIGRWLKQPGDRVERDEPLVEVQTDKVNAEVPSPVAGVLQQILLPEGTTAAVQTDMAVIGDEVPELAGPEPGGLARAGRPAAGPARTCCVGGRPGRNDRRAARAVAHAPGHRRAHEPRPVRDSRRMVARRDRPHQAGSLSSDTAGRLAGAR